jgi:preprotein translocase subunit SecG
VTLVASVVGGMVARAAASAGAGECAGVSSADAVCSQLVATLARNVGLATAVLTAILFLTVIGLSRLGERGEG